MTSIRFLLAAVALLPSVPVMAAPDDIFGTWLRGDGAARVRMATCGEQVCATNVWIKDAARQNEKVGDQLVFKIQPKDDGWVGSGYDPQRGLSLTAELKAGRDSMVTKGCVLGGLMCRSTKWTRM